MTCRLETCPAERFLDPIPPWTEVERWPNVQAAKDSLSAPMFSWEPTRMVRLRHRGRVRFMGAFDAQKVVDLGPGSDVFRIHSWENHCRGSSTYASKRSWPDAWRDSKNAQWMIAASPTVLSQRSVLRAVCACIESIQRFEAGANDPQRRVVEAVKAWAQGSSSPNTVRMAFNAVGGPRRDFEERCRHTILQHLVSAVESYFPADPVIVALYNLALLDTPKQWFESSAEMANVMRRTIPFREVIEGLVGPHKTS